MLLHFWGCAWRSKPFFEAYQVTLPGHLQPTQSKLFVVSPKRIDPFMAFAVRSQMNLSLSAEGWGSAGFCLSVAMGLEPVKAAMAFSISLSLARLAYHI